MRSNMLLVISLALGAMGGLAVEPRDNNGLDKRGGFRSDIHCGQHDYWRCPEYCQKKYGGSCGPGSAVCNVKYLI